MLSPKFNRESRLQPAAPDERSPETANMKWMFKEDHSLGENGGDVLISEENSYELLLLCYKSLAVYSSVWELMWALKFLRCRW